MLNRLRDVTYLVALKWKQGEARAVSTALQPVRRDTLVLFDIPPAGEFDHELGRPLEPTEYIKLFGPRLRKHCGADLVFVDAKFVDDGRHREGLSRHPLTELLERGRLAGARPCPVTAIGRPALYQSAVARFAEDHAQMPICLRLETPDLERRTFTADLSELLDQLRCKPGRVFIVIDLGARQLSEQDILTFAELLVARINELPRLHEWLGIATLMTAFPETIKLKAGQAERFGRLEWIVFRSLWDMRDRLLRQPIYGDYALEYPGQYLAGKKISPVAQFRYTTNGHYLILKGLSTKKPNGYEVIREVARRLVVEPEFQGPVYSLGDRFVHNLAHSEGGPGNASTWRWAWTDHHLTKVWRDLRVLAGLPDITVVPLPTQPADQLELL